MYLFCISCKQIVATIKVPTLVETRVFGDYFLKLSVHKSSYRICYKYLKKHSIKVYLNCLDPGNVHLNNVNAPVLNVLRIISILTTYLQSITIEKLEARNFAIDNCSTLILDDDDRSCWGSTVSPAAVRTSQVTLCQLQNYLLGLSTHLTRTSSCKMSVTFVRQKAKSVRANEC